MASKIVLSILTIFLLLSTVIGVNMVDLINLPTYEQRGTVFINKYYTNRKIQKIGFKVDKDDHIIWCNVKPNHPNSIPALTKATLTLVQSRISGMVLCNDFKIIQ